MSSSQASSGSPWRCSPRSSRQAIPGRNRRPRRAGPHGSASTSMPGWRTTGTPHARELQPGEWQRRKRTVVLRHAGARGAVLPREAPGHRRGRAHAADGRPRDRGAPSADPGHAAPGRLRGGHRANPAGPDSPPSSRTRQARRTWTPPSNRDGAPRPTPRREALVASGPGKRVCHIRTPRRSLDTT